VKVKG